MHDHNRTQASLMMRVTLGDLSRVPVERLAQLLLEWAAEDHSLLSRLHATVSLATDDGAVPAHATSTDGGSDIIGSSAAMRHVNEMLDRYAQTDEPVLITGESGTGKELAARAIHQNSKRHGGRFVAINCAAIPSSLIASELFGYEKGAFTGAAARTKGQIEHADGGTLFLDEIGDMPMDLQAHLLRFLQEGQIVRVGAREATNVNVRVVSATNVRLRAAMAEGRFREDLYYRLGILTLSLPPLRERTGDIEPLARHFLREAAGQFNRNIIDFTPDAIDALCQHPWPGNVRELMSVIRRAVVMSNSPVIAATDLVGLADPDRMPSVPPVSARPLPGSEGERLALIGALERTQENIAETARELSVSRVTLYRMLHRHAISLTRGFKATPGRVDPNDRRDQAGSSSG
ncbi:sigma-54-dependent Fis family transcriptional regulator [Acidisphaera sp. S103]|uniref:sigma-54 interaction domain-containing protein n=1 Tax=Acidisphaera sp. S103 TaxID=1747223 RepID=UPI0020B175D0|nr:sigma-54 dependent transcriptional regulator [Acidisphaera sp. S103]